MAIQKSIRRLHGFLTPRTLVVATPRSDTESRDEARRAVRSVGSARSRSRRDEGGCIGGESSSVVISFAAE